MIDAYLSPIVARGAARFQDVEIGESEPVMLIIVGEERESWIFVNDLGLENIAVLGNHLIETPRHVDDMRELDRLYHWPLPLQTTDATQRIK